ncbi:hypothetical protein TUM22923_11840 [Polynucleobacter sp. TUM22923]|jgi:hypothetical protein|nr:hypothetical protein TUM22923_11840 [Polynucleobacter sp. TUM22923]
MTLQNPGKSASFTKITRQSSPSQINSPSSDEGATVQREQVFIGRMYMKKAPKSLLWSYLGADKH